MKSVYNSPLFKITAASLLLLPSLSFGEGHGAGNGGDILLCQAQGQSTAQFYDLYEGSVNGYPAISTSANDFETAFARVMSRLKEVDPARFEEFQKKESAQFISDMTKIINQAASGVRDLGELNRGLAVTRVFPELKDVPDEGMANYPSHCELKQLYIQFPENDYLDHNALFNVSYASLARLLKQPEDLAHSVLHELYYREAAAKGYVNSRYARDLNEMIAADYSRTQYVSRILANDQRAQASGLSKMQYKLNVQALGQWFAIDSLREFTLSNETYTQAGFYYKFGTSLNLIASGRFDSNAKTIALIAHLDADRVTNSGRDRPLSVLTGSDFLSIFTKGYDGTKEKAFIDNTSAFPKLDPSKGHADGYLFDKDLNLRYFADSGLQELTIHASRQKRGFHFFGGPNVSAYKRSGIKVPNPSPVMEFDSAGNTVYEGSTADFGLIIEKLKNEMGPKI